MKTIFLVIFGAASLTAAPIDISPSFLKSQDFKKRFVGSYGFLPSVEPKINRDEAEVLAELSELLASSNFRGAEQRIKLFIHEQRNPPPPPKKSRRSKEPVEPPREPREVSPALIFTLGNLYFQNGRVKEAETAYKSAIKRHPDYRRAHKNLALLYATEDKIEEAKPHLMTAIELGESDHRTFGLLGYALLKEEKPLAAEAAYRQAYLLNPDEKDWKLGLAQALLAKEKWSEAAVMLQTLIDESPQNALLWKQQANCFIQNEEMMRAAENYEALRFMGLADEASLNQLGDIYANQEEPLLALGAYLSAMKSSDAVDVDRSLKAAGYLLTLGAPEEAGKLIMDLKLSASEGMNREQKVSTLLLESDVAKAEEQLKSATDLLTEALKLEPGNGAVRVRLGQIFAARASDAPSERLGQEWSVEARKYFRIALEDTDEAVAYQANLRFGQLMVKESNFIKALPLLENALRFKKSQSLEQYLRRVQRAAERQKAKEERLRLEAAEKSAG